MRKIRCFYWQIVGNLLYWIVVRYAADIGLIFEDISCWMHHRKMETTKRKGFCELLMCPEFCSVFLYRLRDGNNKIIFHLSKLILKEEKTLFITTPKIGGGYILCMVLPQLFRQKQSAGIARYISRLPWGIQMKLTM